MNRQMVAQTQEWSSRPLASGLLQRKCDRCHEKEKILQRSAVGSAETVPPIVHEVLRSPGAPLDASTRTFMEPRFGHDFSNVRIHTDAKAADSARAVNALAYTVGRDVVFGTSQYRPWTSNGQRLMAHELTHVLQQSSILSKSATPLQFDTINGSRERDALHVANSFGNKKTMRITGLQTVTKTLLQRAPDKTTEEGRKLGHAGLACRNTCEAAHRADIEIARATGDKGALLRAETERDACISDCQKSVDRVPRPPMGRPGILYTLRRIIRYIFGF